MPMANLAALLLSAATTTTTAATLTTTTCNTTCAQLGCGQHGACMLGACACDGGYAGERCEYVAPPPAPAATPDGVPPPDLKESSAKVSRVAALPAGRTDVPVSWSISAPTDPDEEARASPPLWASGLAPIRTPNQNSPPHPARSCPRHPSPTHAKAGALLCALRRPAR